MPPYQAIVIGSIPAVYPGDSIFVLNAERPLTGSYSQQVALVVNPSGGESAPSLSLELSWAADPGAFDYELQDADSDDTDAYQTVPVAGTIIAAVAGPGGKFYARTELVPIKGRFVRLYIKTQTANAVNGSARLSR